MIFILLKIYLFPVFGISFLLLVDRYVLTFTNKLISTVFLQLGVSVFTKGKIYNFILRDQFTIGLVHFSYLCIKCYLLIS